MGLFHKKDVATNCGHNFLALYIKQFMSSVNDLEQLFIYQLAAMYGAEEYQLKTIPGLIERANHRSLQNAVRHHAHLTLEHKKRIEEVILHLHSHGKSFMNIVKEMEDRTMVTALFNDCISLLDKPVPTGLTDAAIIACLQKIEHYEIASYRTALAYATRLNYPKIEALLKETLDEETDADDLLTALATVVLNKDVGAPAHHGDDSPADQHSTGTLHASATHKTISERNITSPGGRSGTSHRTYPNGESRGH